MTTAGTDPTRGKRAKPILIIIVAAVLVGIAVLVVALRQQSDDGGLSAQERKHAITQLEFDMIQEGTTARQALVDQLGPPTDEQGLMRRGWVRKGEFAGICTGTDPSMLPYFALTTDYDAVWYGFCFNGDTLKWKSMYSFGD
jgi:hypothetical protein